MRKTVFRSIVFLAFLFVSIAKIQAQAALLVLIFGDKAATEKFNFSIVGGMNHSNISNQLDNHAMFGPNFGLGINMKLSEKWYFKPEFKPLNSMGFKGNSSLKTGTIVDGPFSNVLTTRSLNYLDIPVMMHYQAAEKILIGFGPQVNFLTKAQEKFEGKNDATYDQNIKDKLNKTDYGFAAAFTYQLITKRNGKGINLQLRYYQGLADVYKNVGSNKNSAFSFNLEFPFISDAVAEKKMASIK